MPYILALLVTLQSSFVCIISNLKENPIDQPLEKTFILLWQRCW